MSAALETKETKAHFSVVCERQVAVSLESLGVPAEGDLKGLVVAFDMDLTLKYASTTEFEPLTDVRKIKIPKRVIRGGETTVKTLKSLRERGATLVVLTGRGPSAVKHQTCVAELDSIGLYQYFDDKDPAKKPQEFRVDGGSLVYGGAGLFVCEYYKPHTLLAFLERVQQTPSRIVFVDDFVVNAVSFGDFFSLSAASPALKETKDVYCVWLDPQPLVDAGEMAGSNSEDSYMFSYRPYLELIMKTKEALDAILPKKAILDTQGRPITLNMQQFLDDVRWGEAGKVRPVLRQVKAGAPFDMDCMDKYKRTALMVAAKHGQREITLMLIKAGASINKQDPNGNSPLMYAAMGGHEGVCKLLIKAGANLSLENKFNKRCDDLAAKAGHLVCADQLSQAGVFDDMDAGYDAATHWKNTLADEIKADEEKLRAAATSGNELAAYALIKADLCELDSVDQHAKTALMIACVGGHVPVVRALVKAGAQLDTQDNDGHAALHLAAQAGQRRAVQYLVDSGCNVSLVNKAGKRAADLTSAANLEILKILKEGGGDETSVPLDRWTKNIQVRLENELETDKFAAIMDRLAAVSTKLTGRDLDISAGDAPLHSSEFLQKVIAGLESVVTCLALDAGIGEGDVEATELVMSLPEPVGED